MTKFKSILNKIPSSSVSSMDEDAVSTTRNWYADRYEAIIVQRNILLLIVLLSLGLMIIGVLVLGKVTTSKTIEPFVLEIEEKSGLVNVVNPIPRKDLTTNEALNTYFIMKYLRARETYNPADYQYNYNTIVRLLSTSQIYSGFRQFINDNPRSPIKIYGNTTNTSLKVRSIQFLDPKSTVQIRFTIYENNSNNTRYNKIATINFTYRQMQMNSEERYVNPLGFQVTGYSVDDEIL